MKELELEKKSFVPDREHVFLLFRENWTAKQVSDRYPDLNYNTLRGWYSKFKTVETVETTVSTVSTTVSTTIKTGETEACFDLEQESDKPVCFESETFVSDFKTPVSKQNTPVLECFETDKTVFETGKTEVEHKWNSLIPIMLLCFTIVAIKYFSVSEVCFVVEQISSVSGVAKTVFSAVVVVSPLVLLANTTSIESKTLLHTIHFVLIVTVLMQVFCCAVSVSQQITTLPKMQQTLANYTFFTPLSFSWWYALFRGSVDICLEFVSLYLIKKQFGND